MLRATFPDSAPVYSPLSSRTSPFTTVAATAASSADCAAMAGALISGPSTSAKLDSTIVRMLVPLQVCVGRKLCAQPNSSSTLFARERARGFPIRIQRGIHWFGHTATEQDAFCFCDVGHPARRILDETLVTRASNPLPYRIHG